MLLPFAQAPSERNQSHTPHFFSINDGQFLSKFAIFIVLSGDDVTKSEDVKVGAH